MMMMMMMMMVVVVVDTEVPLEITTPLQDQEVMEKQAATFVCEVSKPNQAARWLRNGVDVVAAAGRYEVQVDGTRHVLTVKDVEKADEAQYSVHFAGDLSSTAALSVTGTVSACLRAPRFCFHRRLSYIHATYMLIYIATKS